MHTRLLCVLLVLQAVVSFRAVPRILQLFDHQGYVKLGWIPHFTSVINWTLRLGLASLSGIKTQPGRWLAILDHSMALGVKKVLVVLRVSVHALADRGAAIRLADCECIGVELTEHTDGETVYQSLKTIFECAGEPVAIIKDGGHELAKGVRLWREREGKKRVWVIEDIGHVLANALKAQYAKAVAFERFVALIHQGAARLRQTTLAFLLPPKLRTKGRFQGISNLANWAQRLLDTLAGSGDAEHRAIVAKLREAMPGLRALHGFIERFAASVLIVAEVLKVLKHQGLNQQTYHQCVQLTERLPQRCKIRKRLLNWLKRHLHIQCRLGIGQQPLLVSSDIIESLFGTFKHIVARNPQADFNRTILLIPALCGLLNMPNIVQALAHTSHRDLQAWEQTHVPETVRKKRIQFFGSKGTKNRENKSP